MLLFKIILFHSVVFANIKTNRIELFYKKCWGMKKNLNHAINYCIFAFC